MQVVTGAVEIHSSANPGTETKECRAVALVDELAWEATPFSRYSGFLAVSFFTTSSGDVAAAPWREVLGTRLFLLATALTRALVRVGVTGFAGARREVVRPTPVAAPPQLCDHGARF